MTKNLQYTFYEIVCKDEDIDFIYIGSTKDFKKRKYQHKNACINEKNPNYNIQPYQFIRENGGWINFNMNSIEICECETKTHALIREQYWIESRKANFNNRKSFITNQQKISTKKNTMKYITKYIKRKMMRKSSKRKNNIMN